MKIEVKEYMQLQPSYPKVKDTDKYYLLVALHMCKAWDESGILTTLNEGLRKRVVLAITGYYQDIVADAGLWRTFTKLHNEQYGSPLPHYDCSEYIDYELNVQDVRYLIWYILSEDDGCYTPDAMDEQIETLATLLYNVLDLDYAKAPAAEDYSYLWDIDVDSPDERQETYDLAHWLYWRSYMMMPSARKASDSVMDEAQALIAQHGDRGAVPMLHDLNDRLMATREAYMGPISMPLAQWMRYITSKD